MGSVATAQGHGQSILDRDHRVLTAGVILSITAVAFEGLAVTTIAPAIAGELSGLGLYGWIFSAYMLAQIVGTVIAGWDGWRCRLYRLAVAPGRRRSGIGRALIAAAEERFRILGGTRVDAMVLDDNEQAHRIWRACGYRPQGEWSRWIKPL